MPNITMHNKAFSVIHKKRIRAEIRLFQKQKDLLLAVIFLCLSYELSRLFIKFAPYYIYKTI